jgi:deoxyribose-phosphate aldolase
MSVAGYDDHRLITENLYPPLTTVDLPYREMGMAAAGVKVILETSALGPEEKIIGCTLAKLAGAAFVKTSTGFGKGGATVEDVALMRRIVGADVGG